jgi:hypothetical protein
MPTVRPEARKALIKLSSKEVLFFITGPTADPVEPI